MKNNFDKILFFALLLTGCATSKTNLAAQKILKSELKVTSTIGHLKAKLNLTNTSKSELTLNNIDASHFRVQTTDGKVMSYKSKGNHPPNVPVHIGPGQTEELLFDLQNSYAFWDRRTKYEVWYEDAELKTNIVRVWF